MRGGCSADSSRKTVKHHSRSQHKGLAQREHPPPQIPLQISPEQLECYLLDGEYPYNLQPFKDTLSTHFSHIPSVKYVTLRFFEHLFHPFTEEVLQPLLMSLGESRASSKGTSSCWKAADPTTSHTPIKFPPCLWEAFHTDHRGTAKLQVQFSKPWLAGRAGASPAAQPRRQNNAGTVLGVIY